MSTAKTSNKRPRDTQRAVHLAAGVILIAYVYAPFGELPYFEALVRFVVVPGLVASGVLMWQLPRIRKRIRDRARATRARSLG